MFLTKFLVENLPCIIINQDEYKKKQMEKIVSSKYDLFSTRMIIRDYPIIKINNQYHMISYFNVQNSIFSRLVYLLKKIDSKVVADAFEKIIYNQFKLNYSHIAKDILNDDFIQLNPKQKGNELCDILIKKDDKYLFIDCKSKEFIETIYSTDVSELETMASAYEQRLKQIESIKAGKYNKILPQSIDINNVYSLIVVIDDCCFLKEELIKYLSKDIDANSKNYCQKNIDIISYDDLLEFINADVDLIDVLHRCKADNSYFKFIRYNVKQDDKSPYSKSFDEWFDLAKEKMVDMLEEYNILDKNS